MSCEGSKAGGKRKEGIEVPVGVAWMPLLHEGMCVFVFVNVCVHVCVCVRESMCLFCLLIVY